MNILVFDIETVPDADLGRKIYDIHGLSDADTIKAMRKLQSQKSSSDFLPLFLHQVIAISVVLKQNNRLSIWSIGQEQDDESSIIKRFFAGIDQYVPQLVSWNGSNYDLPVLHYRSLKHGINATKYWDNGNIDPGFKWNNYLNRYHDRHLDLMDVIAAFSMKANASLNNVAQLIGLPGKMGIAGDQVLGMYQEGNIQAIRNYCETDVLNTYLVYLRFELIRGNIDDNQYQDLLTEAKDYLCSQDQDHFKQYLSAWQR